MKNKLRQTLLIGKDGQNTAGLRAIEILERFSDTELEYFVMQYLYKATGIPYDYVKTSGPLWAAKTSKRLKMILDTVNGDRISSWLLDYCSSCNKLAQINFDLMPIDKYLTFAEIFNPQVYDDINALLLFEDETKNQEYVRAEYGQPDIYKQPVMSDLNGIIKSLNENGVVLEIQKPKRTLFYNILHLTPERNTTCHATLKSLTEKCAEWFDYSIVTKKSDKYEHLLQIYPIEIKAFEEILCGKRPHYVRTDEPDYTTPFLRTYEFTEITYCHLSELGKAIYRELKEELSKKIHSEYRFKPTGLLKTDLEGMRHSLNYSPNLEAMHKASVICTTEKAFIKKIFPDCIVLSCENTTVKTSSGGDDNKVTMNELLVEIDSELNLSLLNRIHHNGVRLYGTIEYKLTDEGSELGLQVNALSLIV